MKCVIVEDQTMFLQMLHNMLDAMTNLKVVATARTKAEAIASGIESLRSV
jgi:response regulator of citrate/malate metabolism